MEQERWEGQQSYIENIRLWNEEKERKTGKKPLAYLRTFGCQQNMSDGEKLRGMLAEMGFAFTDGPQEADFVLFNTCAVRENAEDRVFGNVGALKSAKARNPDLLVGLCGCMMQQQHIVHKIRKSYPYVDLVFGPHALPKLPELLYRRRAGDRVFDAQAADGEIVEGLPTRRDGHVKAWLPIMYGCDNFCTYCVVPLVRGRERSREPEHVLTEVRELVSQGYKEITLLGQNVNSYGKGLAQPISFAQLLRSVCAVEGEFRVRFMTSHPKDCTQELLEEIALQPKLCNHIHLPVQSGSDRILAAMHRGYSSAQYLSLVHAARERIPGIAFTSDVIVGFPGETEEDFQDTLALVREVGFQSLFTFLYSRREGTKAAELDDPTPDDVKGSRFRRLLDLQQEIGENQYDKLVGQTVRVLAEDHGKSGEGILTGRTASGIIVEFAAPPNRIGEFVLVNITQALHWALLGVCIS